MDHNTNIMYGMTELYYTVLISKQEIIPRFLPNNVAKTKYFLVFVSSIISAKQEFEFWIASRNHSAKY